MWRQDLGGVRREVSAAALVMLGLWGISLLGVAIVAEPTLAETPLPTGAFGSSPAPQASVPDPLRLEPPPAPLIDSLPRVPNDPVTAVVPATPTGPPPGTLAPAPVGDVREISWTITAAPFRDRSEDRFTLLCPPRGQAGPVAGTDVYTEDSSICTAAVHAGRISLESGGTVTIEIKPGRMAFTGSSRQGVHSASRGPWPGSFAFVDPGLAKPNVPEGPKPALRIMRPPSSSAGPSARRALEDEQSAQRSERFYRQRAMAEDKPSSPPGPPDATSAIREIPMSADELKKFVGRYEFVVSTPEHGQEVRVEMVGGQLRWATGSTSHILVPVSLEDMRKEIETSGTPISDEVHFKLAGRPGAFAHFLMSEGSVEELTYEEARGRDVLYAIAVPKR